MSIAETTALNAGLCCPSLEPCNACDQIDIRYRLPFRPSVVTEGAAEQIVPVEVILHFRLERCSGPLTLGDLLYTTTLLPGEKVNLTTSDRQSRFSYDSETQLSSRQYTTSEESFYLAGMANATSDLTVLSGGSQSSSYQNSATSGGGSAGLDLGFVSIGGGVSGASYDGNSASSFANFLSQHAESSSHQVEAGVRAAASTSVSEVATRSHAAGESEDQYESSTRTFSNANRCRAVTYLFYRIDKCQTVTYSLVGIDRRVDDPAAPTGVELNPPSPARNVAVIPDAILGTSASRLQVAQQVNDAIPAELSTPGGAGAAAVALAAPAGAAAEAPISVALRQAALAQVDADLRGNGLIDASGAVTAQAEADLGWTHTLRLPTPGILVKGCLDNCGTCEPARQKEIELDLARKELENQLLKRQIELLDKAQQYRCCPDGDDQKKKSPAA
jgi:hypothetical protein